MLTQVLNAATLSRTAPLRAGGFGSPDIQAQKLCANAVHGFFYARNPVMVGVAGSRKACRFLNPVYQPVASAAQGLVAPVGGFTVIIQETYHV